MLSRESFLSLTPRTLFCFRCAYTGLSFLFSPLSVWIEERGVVPGPGVGERLLDEKPGSTSEVSLLDIAGAFDVSPESSTLERADDARAAKTVCGSWQEPSYGASSDTRQ